MIVMLGVSDGKIILGLLSLIRERETNKSRNVNNDHTKERKREDRGVISSNLLTTQTQPIFY